MSTSMIARATADRGRGTPGSTSGCAPTAAAGHGPAASAGHGPAASAGRGPAAAAGRPQPRLLPPAAAGPVSLPGHLASHGPLPYRGRPEALVPELAAAGLTGRGGAAFPVHRKMAAVLAAGRSPVAVGNGAEGEPASGKDRYLLRSAPHLVLDGLQLAAEAVGADVAVLYVQRDHDLPARMADAAGQRAAAGLDRVRVQVAEAPEAFLSGEESALVASLSGGPAVPAFKRAGVYERGVAGRPTLVQNVETLAQIALIARYGAPWFRGLGTADEPGSMLCSLHRADGRSAITEVPLGTPLRSLLPLGPGVQAVLCGGYHGAWLTTARASQLTLSNAALRPAGAFVGAGVLAELPAGRCGLAETARVMRYLALESAGQCGPCFNGLPRIAAALAELAVPRPAPGALADLRRWSGLMPGRGACHHPDGSIRFVTSALSVFAAETDLHSRGRCTASAGRPFLPLPAAAGPREGDWS
ncbi:MAG: NADH-ubiquinone oxidoreductase-F iron-sulfur binding region domain-containing protein [Streptosporangiaceae bacterium]|jgi:NADH:ubiquinone oxidoreductase subunit F (NADH-binding)